MTKSDAIDQPRLSFPRATTDQQLDRFSFAKRAKRNHTDESLPSRRSKPGVYRRIAPDNHHTHVVWQQRNEDLPQPRIHKSKDFVIIQGKQNSLAQEP